MTKTKCMLLILGLAGSATLHAQSSPLSMELKRFYEGSKNNILRAAEKMPEENYNFRPADTVRSFGGEVAHAAEWQVFCCAEFAVFAVFAGKVFAASDAGLRENYFLSQNLA